MKNKLIIICKTALLTSVLLANTSTFAEDKVCKDLGELPELTHTAPLGILDNTNEPRLEDGTVEDRLMSHFNPKDELNVKVKLALFETNQKGEALDIISPDKFGPSIDILDAWKYMLDHAGDGNPARESITFGSCGAKPIEGIEQRGLGHDYVPPAFSNVLLPGNERTTVGYYLLIEESLGPDKRIRQKGAVLFSYDKASSGDCAYEVFIFGDGGISPTPYMNVGGSGISSGLKDGLAVDKCGNLLDEVPLSIAAVDNKEESPKRPVRPLFNSKGEGTNVDDCSTCHKPLGGGKVNLTGAFPWVAFADFSKAPVPRASFPPLRDGRTISFCLANDLNCALSLPGL